MRASERLILVSNRLPVALERSGDGELVLRRTMGGLATGLAAAHAQSDGRWIGWSGAATEGARLSSEQTRLLKAHGFRGVGLDEEEHERYYLRACNRCIWPLFHGFVERFEFDRGDWDVYRRVNRRFAEAVAEEARPGDLVFVQDFHLLLVPDLVRALLPEVRIGFFLHVPFPPTAVFRALPTRAEALRGVLGSDVIGFHTLEYVRSFRATARRVLGAETTSQTVEHEGRRVELAAMPLGIDPAAWSRPDDDPEVAAALAELRAAVAGRRVILGVERLDYTKGIPERILAFRELLAERPELADEVVFFQIAVPSRVEVEAYRELKEEVEQLAGEVNGRFGRVGLQPLHYQFHGVAPPRLTALYRIADVCMVTPLRDGLNLVAKEFVAARLDDSGVLMLSEFTGAAWELTEALQVNPYDIDGMKNALARALAMGPEEQRERMAPMRERVRRDDVHRWTAACVQAIRGAERRRPPRPVAGAVRSELDRRWTAARRRMVVLDYDGTLRELEPTPDAAVPTAAILSLLEALAAAPGVEPWIVSGRDAEFLGRHFAGVGIGLIAEHGRCARPVGEDLFHQLCPAPPSAWKQRVRPLLEAVRGRVPRSVVEEKGHGLAWHYRAAEPESATWQAHELYLHLGEVLADEPLEVLRGSKVLEVRPAGVSKGAGLARLLDERAEGPDLLVIAGDDVTDESLFKSFPDALSILVGNRVSAAAYRVDQPRDLRALLASWLETTTE